MHAPFSVRSIIHRWLGLALLSSALIGVTAAGARPVDAISGASPTTRTDGRPHAARMLQFADELGLTNQQRTDIQIITTDYVTRLGDLAKLGRAAANSLLNMAPTDADYRQHTDEAAALAASSAAEAVVLLAEMRALLYQVLTAEQRDLLRQKLAAAKLKHAPQATTTD